MTARTAGLTGILLLATAGLSAAAPGSHAAVAAIRNHQFTVLRGMTVENNDGERLGTLSDFILNLESGRVEFGIVKSSGVGPFSQHKIVPSFCFSVSSIKKHTLALDVNDTHWSRAPVFDAKNLQDLANPATKKRIAEFYHFTGDIADKERYSIKTLNPTGPAQDRKTLVLGSHIVGREVLDSAGHQIGKISDLLIDTSQRKDTFAVFSTGGFLKRGQCYAVPLRDLRKTDHKTQLTLPAQIDFAAAAPFEWSDPPPPGIFRYDLKERR